MWKNKVGSRFVEKLDLEGACSDYVIYISIPFCKVRCLGCPYFIKLLTKRDPKDLEKRYIAALLKDIKKWGTYPRWKKGRLRAIYIGGGTGSILQTENHQKLLEALQESFPIDESTEITLEGNAVDYDEEKLDFVAQSIINRISLGVQSFDQRVLEIVGSPHSAEKSASVIKALQSRGITNIQIDMMFNMPKHTIDIWEQDLSKLETLGIKHLTTYLYRIHEGTPQEKFIKEGKVPDIQDRESPMVRQMYQGVIEHAKALGFEMYMFDHFAKKGFTSKYNDWGFGDACDTLGIGAGAYSLIGDYRIGASKEVETYIDTVKRGDHMITSVSVPMDEMNHKERYLIFSFQYQHVLFENYKRKFNSELLDDFGDTILKLKRKGMVEVDEDQIYFTPLGKEWKLNVLLEFVNEKFWEDLDSRKEPNWSMNVPMVNLLSESKKKWLGKEKILL